MTILPRALPLAIVARPSVACSSGSTVVMSAVRVPAAAPSLVSRSAPAPVPVATTVTPLSLISGVLADLARAGFIGRSPDEVDRRRTIVQITPAKNALIEQWLDGAAQPLARVLDRLPPHAGAALLQAPGMLEADPPGQDRPHRAMARRHRPAPGPGPRPARPPGAGRLPQGHGHARSRTARPRRRTLGVVVQGPAPSHEPKLSQLADVRCS